MAILILPPVLCTNWVATTVRTVVATLYLRALDKFLAPPDQAGRGGMVAGRGRGLPCQHVGGRQAVTRPLADQRVCRPERLRVRRRRARRPAAEGPRYGTGID